MMTIINIIKIIIMNMNMIILSNLPQSLETFKYLVLINILIQHSL